MHTSEVRVRFYELDPYNHVNHTNYLAYFETARIDLLDERGVGLDVMQKQGWQLVVVELKAKFHSAAGLHDVLTITTEVGEMGRVTSTWHQEMRRGEQLVATLEVSAAFTDMAGKPRRIPVQFVEAFSSA
ncbi:MAG TPA: thioesterase family protein [Acidimicrobiia bacterium]|nr:thioesterase family protein [Acidimicrobiia bacterium]